MSDDAVEETIPRGLANRIVLALIATLSAYLAHMHLEFDGTGWNPENDEVCVEAKKVIQEYLLYGL